MSDSVIWRGAGQSAPKGMAEGPMVSHGSWSGLSPFPPSHGRCEDALRPAWAIWMPNFAVPMRLQFAITRVSAASQSSEEMPTQPWVMRPRLSTSVISTNTSPAPEFASMPRCVMCQSPITPSAAEYWHIGATLMRLVSSRPLILNGVNRALMGLSGMDGDEGEMRVSNGGPERSSQPRYGQRQRLRARHQRVDHQILIRRVRLAADRPDRAHGRGAARGGEA